MKKTNTKQKGITLVALIITIIVMLILVGVSVNIALNRDLFATTQKAAKETKTEREKEEDLAEGKFSTEDGTKVSLEEYTEVQLNLIEFVKTDYNAEKGRVRATFKVTPQNDDIVYSEVGALVTRKALQDAAEDKRVTLDSSLKKVKGVAYSSSVDNMTKTQDAWIFTGAMEGIPEDKENDILIIRAYAKYTYKGQERVTYSECIYTSVAENKNAGNVI